MQTHTLFTRKSPLGASRKLIRQTFTAHQGKPVQRVSFVSGLHGDEFEGLFLCHRLIEALRDWRERRPEIFRGEVHIYPAANPPALNSATRLWPFYAADMNRMMGTQTGQSVPAQTSRELFEDLKKHSDWVVDIHASNLHLKELPQVRIIEEFSGTLLSPAMQTNTDLVWVHPMAGLFESTLGYNLNRLDIPTLVIETGICLRLEQAYVDRLFHGMIHLLHHLKVLGEIPEEIPPTQPPRLVYPKQVGQACAGHSGLFVSQVKLGDRVRKGEVLGKILNPVEGQILEEVISPGEGLLFTLREQPAAYSGAPLARIALDAEPEP
ncbi:MAG: succinylglutamate desuccinylase [Nitrospinaceae bacterium]|nr:succinylglutamate desuccinylase [Nitrospinaceae bacterium]NIR54260.1 succinylglutamate desuccinylase [Nitrospinaceae bacterium]NIS84677.1 succinylglutamate desuccinylase [Nitrospinaceae bacterium]NIT81472.1 succinylglutamate desuccinylase [Nitrospinaceae bacterium]NIU43756.1 succinylglutamate desuccinylase [Nitrospinaceae bacterium]